MAGVGFIGLGIMGSRMAARLVEAGHEVVVFNRTIERAIEWAESHGATVAESPARLAEQVDTVVTMVVDGAQVEAMLLGPDGVAEAARPGLLAIDSSTIGPDAAERIGAQMEQRGLRFLEAPVSGSAPRAEAGTLTIMAGGDRGDFERALPLLEAMGELIVHVGPRGQGQAVKVLTNAIAAANAATLGQALLVARAVGIDLNALAKVVSRTAGGSTMSELKTVPMIEHDFEPLFRLDHMLKDVRLCLDQASRVGARFPAAEGARELLEQASAAGFGDADFAALVDSLERQTGTRL